MVSSKTDFTVKKNSPNYIFDIARIGMLILSPEGRVLRFNKEASRLIRQSNTLKGKTIHDLFIPDPKFNLVDWYKNSQANKKAFRENKWQIKTEKEEVQWATVHLNLIDDTDTDENLILCQFHEISTSGNPEDHSKDYNNLLFELINNIPDNIFIKDTESRFILANNCVARLMGARSPDELLGKTDYDFFPRKLAGKYRGDELEIIETGKAKLNIIEQVIDKSHNRNWFSTSKIPLKNDKSEIIGIMGIGRDITLLVKEQKALRKAKYEAEKADKLKSAFLANLSHEIRTPLNGILGFSQFLTQYIPPDPKARKYINFIMQNGKRLLHLISDIIDISKIDSKQLTITKKLFSLNELFRQLESSTLEELKLYEKTHITLKSELSLPDNQSYIYSDDQRIKQILHNLLDNAVKFTKEGNISFGYRVVGDLFYSYVKDTGIGIKDEDCLSIFELFTQADNSLGRQYEGAGLGLSIAKGIVLLLGGQIGVNSSYGKGSEFYFTLALDKKEPELTSDFINSKQFENKKILFLGISAETEKLFKSDPLMKETCLDIATNEEECLNLLKSSGYNPDLIICSFHQNEAWILEQVKRFIKNHPKLSLVFITNSRNNFFLKDFKESRRIETIREPVNEYLLIEKIKLLLRTNS